MKKLLTILMLCGVCYGYAQNTPPHAASKKTWKFGGLTWSDAIRIPGCNKTSFTNSYSEPQCRSYTKGSNTWYYYNWAYVNTHAATLCPAPWRVPTISDFDALDASTSGSTLGAAWGYGGYGESTSVLNTDSFAKYWSSTVTGYNAYYLYFDPSGNVFRANTNLKYFGMQVRCVK